MLSSNSKYRVAKLGYNHTNEMGGFHRAGADKNKKVIEISPLLAFWPEKAKE